MLNVQIAAHHLDFPLTFKAMLDNGAHVILIHPDAVEKFQLERFKLKKPEKVSVAISEKLKDSMTLSDFVKFSITTMDNAWTSRTVYAIVTPGLCVPLILRLPFLSRNNIVIDHSDRTAIDKISNYDLLNPVVINPPRCPPPRLHEHLKKSKQSKRIPLTELLSICKKRVSQCTTDDKKIEDLDCIGAIRQTIERLSADERRVNLG
jgi:Aspartyl protease